MTKAKITAEGSTDSKKAQLTVESADGPALTPILKLLRREEGLGADQVAYLVYGAVSSGEWALVDLNDLPSDTEVSVSIRRGTAEPVVTQYKGKQGALAEDEVLLVPDNMVSTDICLAIIDALAGGVSKAKLSSVSVSTLPAAIAERLTELVASKHLGGFSVGRKTDTV